jgi:nitrite reductase (NADH) small subunit
MSKQESPWYQVATVSDIPLRGSRRVEQSGHKIALFRTFDDRIFALRDSCPHKGGPLSAGIVHDNCVTCPLHNWVISLESGEAQGADNGATPVYPVRVVEQKVMLQLLAQATADA